MNEGIKFGTITIVVVISLILAFASGIMAYTADEHITELENEIDHLEGIIIDHSEKIQLHEEDLQVMKELWKTQVEYNEVNTEMWELQMMLNEYI